eukprot:TRINITY_DN5644_c0_g1_i1.p1 TRINITY_DN5644_c0_g1~~TRINITY_DN5644_c0_g1_i1.p1  ORF type:complete len:1674 (-),score=326.55 TRINITY_DN5644_c0_g1_i1:7-4785(-)
MGDINSLDTNQAGFGLAVSIWNGWIAIGAPFSYSVFNNVQFSSGRVWIYKYNESDPTWNQYPVMNITNYGSNTRYGNSVSMLNNILAIGSPGANLVYVYNLLNLNQTFLQISLTDVAFLNLNLLSTTNSNFGYNIDLSLTSINEDQAVMIISAPGSVAYNGSNPSLRWLGLSFICYLKNSTTKAFDKDYCFGLTASTLTNTSDTCGNIVAIGPNYAAMSCIGTPVSGAVQSGIVEIYKRANNGTYSFFQRINSPLPTNNAYFGTTISISDNRISISDLTGSGYTYYISGVFFVVEKTFTHSSAQTVFLNKANSSELWLSNVQMVIPPSVQRYVYLTSGSNYDPFTVYWSGLSAFSDFGIRTNWRGGVIDGADTFAIQTDGATPIIGNNITFSKTPELVIGYQIGSVNPTLTISSSVIVKLRNIFLYSGTLSLLDSSFLVLDNGITLDPTTRSLTLSSSAKNYGGSLFGIYTINLLSGSFQLTGTWDLRNTSILSKDIVGVKLSGSIWVSEITFSPLVRLLTINGPSTIRFQNSSKLPPLGFSSATSLTFDAQTNEISKFSTQDGTLATNLAGTLNLTSNVILTTTQSDLRFTATGSGIVQVISNNLTFSISTFIHSNLYLPLNSTIYVGATYFSATLNVSVANNFVITNPTNASKYFQFYGLLLEPNNATAYFNSSLIVTLSTIDGENNTIYVNGQLNVVSDSQFEYFSCPNCNIYGAGNLIISSLLYTSTGNLSISQLQLTAFALFFYRGPLFIVSTSLYIADSYFDVSDPVSTCSIFQLTLSSATIIVRLSKMPVFPIFNIGKTKTFNITGTSALIVYIDNFTINGNDSITLMSHGNFLRAGFFTSACIITDGKNSTTLTITRDNAGIYVRSIASIVCPNQQYGTDCSCLTNEPVLGTNVCSQGVWTSTLSNSFTNNAATTLRDSAKISALVLSKTSNITFISSSSNGFLPNITTTTLLSVDGLLNVYLNYSSIVPSSLLLFNHGGKFFGNFSKFNLRAIWKKGSKCRNLKGNLQYKNKTIEISDIICDNSLLPVWLIILLCVVGVAASFFLTIVICLLASYCSFKKKREYEFSVMKTVGNQDILKDRHFSKDKKYQRHNDDDYSSQFDRDVDDDRNVDVDLDRDVDIDPEQSEVRFERIAPDPRKSHSANSRKKFMRKSKSFDSSMSLFLKQNQANLEENFRKSRNYKRDYSDDENVYSMHPQDSSYTPRRHSQNNYNQISARNNQRNKPYEKSYGDIIDYRDQEEPVIYHGHRSPRTGFGKVKEEEFSNSPQPKIRRKSKKMNEFPPYYSPQLPPQNYDDNENQIIELDSDEDSNLQNIITKIKDDSFEEEKPQQRKYFDPNSKKFNSERIITGYANPRASFSSQHNKNRKHSTITKRQANQSFLNEIQEKMEDEKRRTTKKTPRKVAKKKPQKKFRSMNNNRDDFNEEEVKEYHNHLSDQVLPVEERDEDVEVFNENSKVTKSSDSSYEISYENEIFDFTFNSDKPEKEEKNIHDANTPHDEITSVPNQDFKDKKNKKKKNRKDINQHKVRNQNKIVGNVNNFRNNDTNNNNNIDNNPKKKLIELTDIDESIGNYISTLDSDNEIDY